MECPLQSKNEYNTATGSLEHRPVQCSEDNCAWWHKDTHYQCCAVKRLAMELARGNK